MSLQAATSRQAPITDEILTWRFAGAAVWHQAAFIIGYTAWAVTSPSKYLQPGSAPALSFAGFSAMLFMCFLQFTVLFAKRMVMSSQEPAPVFVPVFGIHGRSWPGLLVSRILIRHRRIQDVISTACLLAATIAAAATTIYTFSPPSGIFPNMGFSTGYGICLGCLYTVHHLARCREVLAYPIIHRHRSIQLRQRLPTCIFPAIKLAATAAVIALLAGYRPASWQALVSAIHASAMVTWGWLAGHAALEVVMTEPLRMATTPLTAGRDPLRAMLDVLADNNPVIQDLGLSDLVDLGQGRTAMHKSWRAAVWSDESGRSAWTPLANTLFTELRDFIIALSAALPGAAPTAIDAATQAAAAASQKRQWNVLSMGGNVVPKGVSRAQDVAAWTVRAKGHRVSCALRALAGLAAASRTEDRYGVVLLSDPAIGDITVLLLSCILVTQQYTKAASAGRARNKLARALHKAMEWTGAPPHPSLQPEEVLSQALEDVAKGCAYQVVAAFGPSLATAVNDARYKPSFGSFNEVGNLLSNMLAYRE